MTDLFPWLLLAHVAGAIVAFGPTFAFALIGAMGGREPQFANFATRVSLTIEDRIVLPFALSVFVTGALMIWIAEIPLFERDARWLLVAIVLYLIALSLSAFVSRPAIKRVVELTRHAPAAGDGPPAGLRESIGIVQKVGPILTMLTLVVIFLMVIKPDFGF